MSWLMHKILTVMAVLFIEEKATKTIFYLRREDLQAGIDDPVRFPKCQEGKLVRVTFDYIEESEVK